MADEGTFALSGDGLYEVTWDGADAPLRVPLLASPADARGRGMDLSVVRGGEAVDLTGATAYLLWRHREARARGCEPFEAVDAEHGRFRVFWPASMACAEGTVDAQVVVCGGDEAISSAPFAVRVSAALASVEGSGGDGYSMFSGGDPEVRGGRRADRRRRREGAAGGFGRRGGVRRDRCGDGRGRGGDRGEGRPARGGGARRLRRRPGRRGRRRAGRCRRPGRREPDGEGGADRDRTLITVTDASGTTTATLAHGQKGDALTFRRPHRGAGRGAARREGRYGRRVRVLRLHARAAGGPARAGRGGRGRRCGRHQPAGVLRQLSRG